MDKKQKHLRPSRTGRRKARLAKLGRSSLSLQPIASDPMRLALLEWHGPSKRLVANIVLADEANAVLGTAKRPTITPIRGDPSHVIRCDWVDGSGWHCDIISVTDPRAHP